MTAEQLDPVVVAERIAEIVERFLDAGFRRAAVDSDFALPMLRRWVELGITDEALAKHIRRAQRRRAGPPGHPVEWLNTTLVAELTVAPPVLPEDPAASLPTIGRDALAALHPLTRIAVEELLDTSRRYRALVGAGPAAHARLAQRADGAARFDDLVLAAADALEVGEYPHLARVAEALGAGRPR